MQRTIAAALGPLLLLGAATLAAQAPQTMRTPSAILVPTIESVERNVLLRLTSAEDGVSFDIDGDGRQEQIGWTEAGADVGFLALDRNENGIIDNGRELFGSHTLPGSTNGFDALSVTRGHSPASEPRPMPLAGSDVFVRDYNKSWIQLDHYDALFAKLLLWTDRNHNGISEHSELAPVGRWLAEIGLNYNYDRRVDGFGNRYAFKGWANVRPALGKMRTTGTPVDKGEIAMGQLDLYEVCVVVR